MCRCSLFSVGTGGPLRHRRIHQSQSNSGAHDDDNACIRICFDLCNKICSLYTPVCCSRMQRTTPVERTNGKRDAKWTIEWRPQICDIPRDRGDDVRRCVSRKCWPQSFGSMMLPFTTYTLRCSFCAVGYVWCGRSSTYRAEVGGGGRNSAAPEQ